MTTFVPAGKKLPAGTPPRVTVTPEQLSLAVAAPKASSPTKAPHEVAPGPVATVTAGGAVIVGGVWSTTVTIAGAEFVTPRLSVVTSLTVCGPRPNGPAGSSESVRSPPLTGSKEPSSTSPGLTPAAQESSADTVMSLILTVGSVRVLM